MDKNVRFNKMSACKDYIIKYQFSIETMHTANTKRFNMLMRWWLGNANRKFAYIYIISNSAELIV